MVQKEETLADNFKSLQEVLVVLSERMDKLTKQMGTLLDLFEKAAAKFNKEDASSILNSKEDADLLNKLDRLLEENRTIAKALTLLEQRVRT
jgi:predicted RNA binding protein with dsRBD fold (UPF0201 family)